MSRTAAGFSLLTAHRQRRIHQDIHIKAAFAASAHSYGSRRLQKALQHQDFTIGRNMVIDYKVEVDCVVYKKTVNWMGYIYALCVFEKIKINEQ